MRKIKIFIGSSIVDLKDERKELVCFIQGLNNRYIDKGIYIEPFVCEELSGEIRTKGTQRYIDEYIENDADAAFFMFFEKAGEYTQGELELARNIFLGSERKRPKVFVFFKAVENGIANSEDVLAVAKKVAGEYAHYYKKFTDADTVKLEIMQLIASVLGGNDTISVVDGLLSIGDISLQKNEINAENVYAYRNNPDVKRLSNEIKSLKEELVEAIQTDDREEKIRINEALEKDEKEYAELTKNILEAIKLLYKEMSGTSIDPTRVKALEYIEEGNYKAALELISQESINASVEIYTAEREAAEEILKQSAEDIVENAVVRISALKLALDDPERFAKIEQTYDAIEKPAEDAGCFGVLYNFASFLYDEKKYNKAIKNAEILRWLYSKPDCPANDMDKGKLYNLLALLYTDNGRPEEAEKLYRETLENFRHLVKERPSAFDLDISAASNNLADLYEYIDRLEGSEWPCLDTPETGCGLDEKDVDCEMHIAVTSNNLALLYKNNGKLEDAEKLFLEALELFHRLAKEYPTIIEPYVALTCNNLADLYKDIGQMAKAGKLYFEALELRRCLAEENPNVHEIGLADTCNDLAYWYKDYGRWGEAKKLYREALTIRRRLAKNNPAAHEPDFAAICNNLAVFYTDIGSSSEEAEKLYIEALEIRHRLAKEHPAAYEPDVADTCNNIANLYKKTGRPEDAEKLYLEALDIRRRLAKEHPTAYEPDVATSCYSLAALYENIGRAEEAEKLNLEAYETAKKHPQNSSCKQIIDILTE